VLNAQGQTSVGVEVPGIVIAETILPGPSSSSTADNAQSSWYTQPPFPQPPILYGNGDYTELREYGGSEHVTDDEEHGATIVLLPRPISTTLHIRIPPKCYIYVMTTTGRQPWMLPGVYCALGRENILISKYRTFAYPNPNNEKRSHGV
jgi:hypothetical protein